MLQIRLSKSASEGAGGAKPSPVDTVTVACPDHLVLADLPVAKSLGSASATAVVKTVGRKSRRQLGERVHFCVRCDYPIAIYGRLSPCEHAFCLDCARSDSLCYLCDERVQKIQTIKMMEGLFICAAPHCLKSFLNKAEFKSHIYETHADLLPPNSNKDGTALISARKSLTSESTVQASPMPVFSPGSNSQSHDCEDKGQHTPSRDQPPAWPAMSPRPVSYFPGQTPNHHLEQEPGGNQSQVFDVPPPQNCFPLQAFDSQGGLQQDSVPINPNPVPVLHQFGYAPGVPDGTQQIYGAPYETARPNSTPEVGSGVGSLQGFMPGPGGSMPNYPPPWNTGPAVGSFQQPPVGPGNAGGFMNTSGPQGRPYF